GPHAPKGLPRAAPNHANAPPAAKPSPLPMKRLSRRSFLAASAAAAAGPALAAPRRAPPPPQEPVATGSVDVVIVGAGAAGIAAARRLVAAKRRGAVLEAAHSVGGRCVPATRAFRRAVACGAPFT